MSETATADLGTTTRSNPPIWLDGTILAGTQATVGLDDRGVTHGLGIFETLLVLDGRPAFWAEHLCRLQTALARLGWEQVSLPDWRDVLALWQRTPERPAHARLRLAVSGGVGGLTQPSRGRGRRVWMTIAEIVGEPPRRAMWSPWRRNEQSPLAGMKCASYAENLLALEHAESQGYHECLWLNGRGELCEASTANVFLVREGELLTPRLESGCLPGVTRAWVLAHAKSLGYACHEARLTKSDVASATEIILTSATRGPVALLAFSDRALPSQPVAVQLANFWTESAIRSVTTLA